MSPCVLAAAALALTLAWWLTGRVAAPGSRLAVLDRPNERSLHTRPTPRSGGVAITAAFAAGVCLVAGLALSGVCAPVPAADLLVPLGAFLALAALSLRDDRRGLSAALRLALQSVAAAALVAAGYMLPAIAVPGGRLLVLAPPVVAGLTLLLLLWMMNLYNFMDGMDGFAGGMTVIGFGFLAVLGGDGGAVEVLAPILAASALGFLVHNWPPARVFMGDAGSVPIGMLAGLLIVAGEREGAFDLWQGLLVFSPFVVDATVTIARRLARGERVWRPHREHHYQRLVLAGWSHRRTVLCEYALMLACGLSAIAYGAMGTQARLALLAAWAVIYIALSAAVGRVERRR